MNSWIPAALLLAAACSAPPEVRPPPFGEDGNVRLFYPTGLAATPGVTASDGSFQSGGDLVVANSNFDHAYDASTVVTLKHSLFATQMALGLDWLA